MRIVNEQPTSDAPGEALVLQWLHRLKDDWIVIHQARFPKRRKFDLPRVIDFIFVVPGHGVLALEVKSSPNVEYVEGAFRVGKDATDPFTQVDDEFGAMHRWHQVTIGGQFGPKIPMTAVLGFTSALPIGPQGEGLIQNPRTHNSYQVLFADSFQTPETMRDAVFNALTKVSKDWGTTAAHFGQREAEYWVDQLMPSVPITATQSAHVSKFISVRDDFTEDQQKVYYVYLKKLPKVFISGAWGTGKTFLAMHIAFSSASEGRHVCVVVKRKELLGQLKDDFQEEIKMRGPLAGSLDVRTVDSILYGLAQNSDKRYDELVLDQAEDFLDLKTLESLGNALVGGWSAESRVKIFADFENQGYQSPAAVKEVLDWLERTGFVGVREKPLSHNLRNGKSIAREVEKIGRKRVYTDYLPEEGQVRSHVVDLGDVWGIMTENLRETPLRTWNVSQALIDVLKELKREGYAPGDVVVLTALPRTTSTAGEPSASQSSPAFVAMGWDYKMPSEGELRNGHDGSPERPYVGNDFRWPHNQIGLTDDWIPKDRIDVQWEGEVDENDQMIGPDLRRRVTWCTVEEFAGCESTVIVLTDVHMAKKSVRERRLTRGLSRASQRAVLIVVNVPKPENDY